jgi:hypothetical protein
MEDHCPDPEAFGYNALVNAPGPENAVRFIPRFDPGSGDYTRERKRSFQEEDGTTDREKNS